MIIGLYYEFKSLRSQSPQIGSLFQSDDGYHAIISVKDFESQSPQIGSLFQYFKKTSPRNGAGEVSIPSNRVIVSIEMVIRKGLNELSQSPQIGSLFQ